MLLSTQVGVIIQVIEPGDTCLVEWEGGARRTYNIGAKVKVKGKGKGKVQVKGSFQLVHLELSHSSGGGARGGRGPLGQGWTIGGVRTWGVWHAGGARHTLDVRRGGPGGGQHAAGGGRDRAPGRHLR